MKLKYFIVATMIIMVIKMNMLYSSIITKFSILEVMIIQLNCQDELRIYNRWRDIFY